MVVAQDHGRNRRFDAGERRRFIFEIVHEVEVVPHVVVSLDVVLEAL